MNWRFAKDSAPVSTASPPAESAALPAVEESWSRALLLAAFWLLLVELGLAWKLVAGLMTFCAGLLVFILHAVASTSASSGEFLLRVMIPLALVLAVVLWQKRGWTLR